MSPSIDDRATTPEAILELQEFRLALPLSEIYEAVAFDQRALDA